MKMRQRRPAPFTDFLLLLILLLPIILGGCVSKSHWVWKNPEKPTELLLLKDKKTCRDLARTEVAQINYYYDFYAMDYLYDYPFYPLYYRDRYRRPFFRGYHHYRFMQEQDDLEHFFRICMKAKGWQRVKLNSETK